jgi:uncharacterized protein involved in cysteine biosynthesis
VICSKFSLLVTHTLGEKLPEIIVIVYVAGLFAAIAALLAAYFRLLARTEELRKLPEPLKKDENGKVILDGPAYAEKLQDRAAGWGFVATILAVAVAAIIPQEGLDELIPRTVGGVLAVLWVVAGIHVLVLFNKYSKQRADLIAGQVQAVELAPADEETSPSAKM